MTTIGYRFVVASAVPAYARSDTGSGRCRIPSALFESLGLRLGSCVIWAVGDERKVLCTAWPDTAISLGDNEVCIDATVFLSSPASESYCSIPSSGTCRFVKSIIARVGSSVHASLPGVVKPKISLAMLHGLPLAPSCIVLANPSFGRSQSVLITRTQPGEACVAGFGTLVVNVPCPPKPRLAQAAPPRCCTSVVLDLVQTIVLPVLHIPPAQQCHGVLLLGPPGVGKTFAVRALQRAVRSWCCVKVREVSISELLVSEDLPARLAALLDASCSGGADASEEEEEQEEEQSDDGVVMKFTRAGVEDTSPVTQSQAHTLEQAQLQKRPVLHLFVLDEVDLLGSMGPRQSDVQATLVQLLCEWLDAQGRLHSPKRGESAPTNNVCIIASTNHTSQVDKRLRRGGRLERELEVHVSSHDRKVLLTGLVAHALGGMASAQHVASAAAETIALRTGGYVAADLNALVTEALQAPPSLSLDHDISTNVDGEEVPNQLIAVVVNQLSRAMQIVRPSALRGATVALPNLSYDDVVGLDEPKRALRRVLSFCSSDPNVLRRAERLGLTSAGGVLLYGPPGNSKTRLVMAVASAHALPVISLSAADIYSPYVGDAEAEVRRAFRLARQSAPCVLFLDEMDAIVTDRSDGAGGEGASVEARVLATLLTEMDGIDGKHGVVVLGATNRVECIDAALVRKGRFHHLLFVPPPDATTAELLLRYFAAKSPALSANRIEELLAAMPVGLSGAEIENYVREECMNQIREKLIRIQK